MKQLQFELWSACNSRCKFCYLGEENRCTPDHYKIQALKDTLEKISNLEIYKEYNTLSYLGGEFFQGQLNTPEIHDLFMQLMEKTAWLLKNKYIEHVWLYATMTLGDQKDLYEAVKFFDGHPNFWILTSYDTLGRFHTKQMEETWSYNMLKLHELYPDIKFNITSILSEDLIDKYLAGTFSFKEMMKKYNCTFFLKQCGKGPYTKEEFCKRLPHFFPPRKKFLDFLRKFKQEESDEMWTKLFDIHYRADTLYRNYNTDDRRMELNTRNKESKVEEMVKDECAEINKCGHLMNYAAYSDSDKCCLCDKLMIDNSL